MKPTGATKQAAGHSPLPWKVVEHDFICSGESTVAELTYCPQPKDERRANAQLIVTAVNERERLRAAIDDAIDKLERASLVQDHSVHIVKQACRFVAKNLRTILNDATPSTSAGGG